MNMIDITKYDVRKQVAESEDYKVIIKNGWTYIFPSDAVATANFGLAELEELSTIIIDHNARVIKSRFGIIYG